MKVVCSAILMEGNHTTKQPGHLRMYDIFAGFDLSGIGFGGDLM